MRVGRIFLDRGGRVARAAQAGLGALVLGLGLLAAPAGRAATAQAAASPLVQIQGQALDWPELYFWLRQAAQHRQQPAGSAGPPPPADWPRLREQALAMAAQHRAIATQAAAQGLVLSADDRAGLQAQRERLRREYGSDEYARIVIRMYGSEAMFERLAEVDLLGQRLFERLWGPHGERCTDAQVREALRAEGRVPVKLMRLNLQDEDGQPLPAQEQAARRVAMLRLAETLDALPPEAAQRRFDDEVARHGEDEAMLAEPGGRLLTRGSLGPRVDEALDTLTPGQRSGLIDTGRALLLLWRLPVDPDMPIGGTGRSLRYWTAYEFLFRQQVTQWAQALPIQASADFAQVDLGRWLH